MLCSKRMRGWGDQVLHCSEENQCKSAWVRYATDKFVCVSACIFTVLARLGTLFLRGIRGIIWYNTLHVYRSASIQSRASPVSLHTRLVVGQDLVRLLLTCYLVHAASASVVGVRYHPGAAQYVHVSSVRSCTASLSPRRNGLCKRLLAIARKSLSG